MDVRWVCVGRPFEDRRSRTATVCSYFLYSLCDFFRFQWTMNEDAIKREGYTCIWVTMADMVYWMKGQRASDECGVIQYMNGYVEVGKDTC